MSTQAPSKWTPKNGPELQKGPQKSDEEDFAQRSLPNALGPEKSLLSSMLQDPSEYVMRSEELGLTPEHFYHPSHQTLYRVIKDLSEGSTAVELVSLTQLLMDRGVL